MADNDTIELSVLVEKRCVQSQFKNEVKDFLPEGGLHSIVTKPDLEKVFSVFAESNKQVKELVSFVLTKALKIFTITVLVDIGDEALYKAMALFKGRHYTDKDLPMDVPPLTGDIKSNNIFSSLGWKRTDIKHFYEKQWIFLAPVLKAATSKRPSNSDFEHRRILPFTEQLDTGFDNRGAFGQVSKYRVHPSHLDDPEGPQDEDGDSAQYLAVKELQPRSEDERRKMITNWEREASVLQKMNALRQDHIVRFITAFRRLRRGDGKGKEEYYLVFEWADGGNLRNLWKTFKRPCLTPALMKAAVQQILGLATALCKAHYPETGPTFRHGDLKPENILWFASHSRGGIGTLKIADWGLAKEHNIETELRSKKTSTEYGTRRYEPPEEYTGEGIALPSSLNPNQASGRQQKKRSRLYDVWAMGCITLEFIVWLLHGINGWKQFNAEISCESSQSPPFYQVKMMENGKKKAEVHPAVVKWMNNMAKLPACEPGVTALGNLLELVQTRLLVIELPIKLGTSSTLSLKTPPSRLLSPQSSDTTAHNLAGDSNPDTPAIVISGVDAEPAEVHKVAWTTKSIGKRPPASLTTQPKGRACSDEFVQRMNEIYLDHENEDYWLSSTDNPEPSPPESEAMGSLSIQATSDEYQTSNCTIETLPSQGPIATDRKSSTDTLMVRGNASRSRFLAAPTQHRIDYGSTKLDSDWDVSIDNDFAADVFVSVSQAHRDDIPVIAPSSNLCELCERLRVHIWDATFDMIYEMSQLNRNYESKACDLCALFWRTCMHHGVAGYGTVTVKRIGSSLVINDTSSSLSIFRSPDLKTRIDESVQIGFGRLPEANSEPHFEVIRKWLAVCDRGSHRHHIRSSCLTAFDTPTSQNGSAGFPTAKKTLLPTRVLDVGQKGDDKVYLRLTKPGEAGEWLALSYQWGPKPHFCTTASNLDSHLRGIAFGTLPDTFRDAVIVTRALGCRYLWIDSLCIIQGEGGDFNQQAKRMEQVYSGAYCVLAISHATSHYGGFLHPRRERSVVALSPIKEESVSRSYSRISAQAPTFYICEPIDDFNAHVLESGLSRRGWVLQEHALARRTVFFTEYQTYFECGDGVRCETMMRMKNSLASFLGDPSFPHIIMKANQAEKILRYQDLYKRYSRLGLTNAHDRPTAIDGLQDRLLSALVVPGGFGVFDEGDKRKGLLRRSLLWRCAEIGEKEDEDEVGMKRIVFPPGRRHAIPSWSWMAYSGAIDYITPVFGRVEWAELESPWSGGGGGGGGIKKGLGDRGGDSRGNKSSSIALLGEAWEYSMVEPSSSDGADGTVKGRPPLGEAEMLLVFDAPSRDPQLSDEKTLCIIMGIQKGDTNLEERRYYVLLVKVATTNSPERELRNEPLYERVGAGYLPERYIDWSHGSVRVTVH